MTSRVCPDKRPLHRTKAMALFILSRSRGKPRHIEVCRYGQGYHIVGNGSAQ